MQDRNLSEEGRLVVELYLQLTLDATPQTLVFAPVRMLIYVYACQQLATAAAVAATAGLPCNESSQFLHMPLLPPVLTCA